MLIRERLKISLLLHWVLPGGLKGDRETPFLEKLNRTTKTRLSLQLKNVAGEFPLKINFFSPKKSIKINNNTNRAIDVTRNNFVSPSRFSVLNCDEVSSSVLGDEINISNVLKTRHNDTTRPIQDAVQNPRRPPLVINNSPENQHDFRRLKAVPGENSYSEAVEDHKGNEKIL